MDRIPFAETPRGIFWTGRQDILMTLHQMFRYKTFKKDNHVWSKRNNMRGENCGQIQCIDRSSGTKEDRETSF